MNGSSNVTRRGMHLAMVCAVVSTLVWTPSAAAGEKADCSDQLEQIPRAGSTIDVVNPWLTYSGNVVYGGLADRDTVAPRLTGADQLDLEIDASRSYAGIRSNHLSPGDYQWGVGDGPKGQFEISRSAEVDETAPQMGDGDVEASLELVVYDDFPVLYRHWTVSFPAGDDDATDAENMRYRLEFRWEDGDQQESAQILITPDRQMAVNDRLEVELGGRTDFCHHAEPNLPLTAQAELAVRAVDLAGNVSDNAATGVFDGVAPEKLAAAHDEFNEVIEELRHADDEESETIEEDDEASDSGGCATASSSPPAGLVVVLFVFFAVVLLRSPDGVNDGRNPSAPLL